MKKTIYLFLCAVLLLFIASCGEIPEPRETASDESQETTADELHITRPYKNIVPGYEKLPESIEKELFETEILKPMFEATRHESASMSFEEYITLRNSKYYDEQARAMKAESFELGRFLSFFTLLDPEDPELTPLQKDYLLHSYPITEETPIYVLLPDLKRIELDTLEKYITEYTNYEPDQT